MGYKFQNKTELQTAISAWNGIYLTDWHRENRPASSYYGDPNSWDVSAINDFSSLAFGSFNFDIGNWDVSNGTDFSFMFNNAIAFNQDIGDWDVNRFSNWAFEDLKTKANEPFYSK